MSKLLAAIPLSCLAALWWMVGVGSPDLEAFLVVSSIGFVSSFVWAAYAEAQEGRLEAEKRKTEYLLRQVRQSR